MIIACLECGKRYQLPEDMAGVRFRCSECRAVIHTSDESTHVIGDPSDGSSATKEHYLICPKGHVLLPADREFVFGRALQSDYLLDNHQASRRHSTLHWNGEAFVLSDLNSRNGTFYKGEPIHDPVTLQDGDEFSIANEQYTYRVVGDFEDLRTILRESSRFHRSRDTEELHAIDTVLPQTDFNGSLKTMGPTEICQILKLGRRSGRLFILDDEHARCILYFSQGEIVGANYGHYRGDEAVLAACRIQQGIFSFQTKFRCSKPNVDSPTQFLLLEAARQKDETT